MAEGFLKRQYAGSFFNAPGPYLPGLIMDNYIGFGVAYKKIVACVVQKGSRVSDHDKQADSVSLGDLAPQESATACR